MSAGILQVLAARSFAQICDSIIVPDAVDMIDIANRPSAVNIKPCKAMRPISPPVNVKGEVPARCVSTRYRMVIEALLSRFSPEHPRLGIINDDPAQPLRG